MHYVIRLTLKKSSKTRMAFPERKHAYLAERGGCGFKVACGNLETPEGRLVPCPNPVGRATAYASQGDAAAALARYVVATEWRDTMWVHNPKIVEVGGEIDA